MQIRQKYGILGQILNFFEFSFKNTIICLVLYANFKDFRLIAANIIYVRLISQL